MREKLTLGGYFVIVAFMLVISPFTPLILAELHRNGGVISGIRRELQIFQTGGGLNDCL